MSTATANEVTTESSNTVSEAEKAFIAMVKQAREKNPGKPVQLAEETTLRKVCRTAGKVTVGGLVVGGVYLAINAIFSGE